MTQNLIAQTITDTQRDAMLADLASFNTKFAPYLVNLTPADIAGLAKIKSTDIGALEVAQTFAQQNPASISVDMNITGLNQDVGVARQLSVLLAAAQQKTDMIQNSLIAALSDGRVTADALYRVEKAKGKTPQNEAFLEAYGARYARGPQTQPAPVPTP